MKKYSKCLKGYKGNLYWTKNKKTLRTIYIWKKYKKKF